MKNEMRSIAAVAFIAIVLGLALGASSASFRFRHSLLMGNDSDGELAKSRAKSRAQHDASPGSAKVEVDSEAFNFGEMDADKEGSHEFVFTNRGNGALTLSTGESTCRCTVSEITKAKLAPGESTAVRVTWKSKKVGGPFKQRVTIRTNDPNRPEVNLYVSGKFNEVVRVDPGELDFGHLVDNEPTTREARILCNLPNRPLEIVGVELTNEELAKYFEVKTRSMTADEIIQEKHIGSGIVASVTAKPGLPPGRFQQRILLRTNLPHPQDEIELDLSGSMGKEVSVAGMGWDDDIGVLNIGPLKVGTRIQRQLFLMARGADAESIRYNVVHVEPDFLQVKLGDTDVTEKGKLSRTKLTIEIPARDAAASYMDDGHGQAAEIDIDTTSSEVHQVKIRVRFAVEGNARNGGK